MADTTVTPPTLAEFHQLAPTTFAYRLANDPSPGNKVMHLQASGEHLMFALAKTTQPYMAPGVLITDVAQSICLNYYHMPNQIMEITAPDLVHEVAPGNLDFTVASARHGLLQYHYVYVPDYQQKQAPATPSPKPTRLPPCSSSHAQVLS